MKKSAALSIFFISLAVLVTAASLYLWQSEKSRSRDLTASIYSDAFLGFLHAGEDACAEIERFDVSSPSPKALSVMEREAELCSFYFSRLPVPYGMLSSLCTFLRTAPEYFSAVAEGGSVSRQTTENIASLKGTASALKQALSDIEKRFLSAEDAYSAVCDFFHRETYVRAGRGDGDFSAFILDDILYDMPTLSYGGELSSHQRGMGFSLLRGADELDAKKAREAASEYLGQNISHYRYAGLTDGFPACHIFSFGDAYVSISKNGGYVMAFSLSCKVYESRLSGDLLERAAAEKAQGYGFGVCDAEYLFENAGIVYFSCVPKGAGTMPQTREAVILGLDAEYGNMKYLSAYDYYKYHGIDAEPTTG